MIQKSVENRVREQEPVEDQAPQDLSTSADEKAKLDDDIDSILADIDNVLELNAEEFVRAYVQKGGQ